VPLPPFPFAGTIGVSMTKRTTKEEKVAKILVYSVNDLTLDLDLVGEYVAEISTTVLYNRLDLVMETAREERYGDSRELHQEKLDRLNA